jgi:hypothetical protein
MSPMTLIPTSWAVGPTWSHDAKRIADATTPPEIRRNAVGVRFAHHTPNGVKL